MIHWADGGETSLANTLLLCGHHHRLVHEGGWTVEWWSRNREPAFRDPRGQLHTGRRKRPPRLPADPVAALVRRNRLRGADPGPRTVGATWTRERDIPDETYFRGLEAVS